MTVTSDLVSVFESIVGPEWIRRDPEALLAYGTDALKKGHPADLVAYRRTRGKSCDRPAVHTHRRAAGAARRRHRLHRWRGAAARAGSCSARAAESDPRDRRGEPARRRPAECHHGRSAGGSGTSRPLLSARSASLHESVIGGNVAECAGGPRAFKYGTTKRYVLGLEAVLPTGEIVRTGSKPSRTSSATTSRSCSSARRGRSPSSRR